MAYSLRNCSLSWVSRNRADFVRAFGWKPTALLGRRRFLGMLAPSTSESVGVAVSSSASVGLVVPTVPIVTSSSSSSPTKDRPPFFAAFFLFLNAGLLFGSLHLGCQYPCIRASVIVPYRPSGVVVPLVAGVASRESSMPSRLFLKSSRCTKPTVCSLRRSSVVWLCDANRGLGVDVREGELEDGVFAMSVTIFLGAHEIVDAEPGET